MTSATYGRFTAVTCRWHGSVRSGTGAPSIVSCTSVTRKRAGSTCASTRSWSALAS